MLRASGMPSSVAVDSMSLNSVTKTANYTQAANDTTIRFNASSGALVLSLMPAASVAERILMVKKVDATVNTVTIDPAGAETIDGSANFVLSNANDSIIIQSNGVSWDIVASK